LSSFLPQQPIDEKALSAALGLMEVGRFSAALRVLGEIRVDDHVVGAFALGVCLFRAGAYERAAGCFEKSLAALKRMKPLGMAVTKTDEYMALRVREIAEQTYLTPLRIDVMTAGFLESAREDMIMAAAEAYFQCGDVNRAQTRINSLNGAEFDQIKARINQ